jgi:hypothetical protein
MYPEVEQLRDIHGIQGVPWWPPAPGWWLLAGAVLVLGLVLWRWRTPIRLRIPPLPIITVGSWRWDAARQVRDLRRRMVKQDAKQTAGELSELLRRIAMARIGREACAGLTGQAWLDWLRGHDPNGFDWTERGRVLLRAPYAPLAKATAPEELIALIDAAYAWVAAEDKKRV